MSIKQVFLELANMNAWANAQLRQTIQNIPFEVLEANTHYTPFGSLGNLVIHLFNAINVWLDRIEGVKQSAIRTLGDFEDWPAVLAAWESADQRFIRVISELPGKEPFNQIISYKSLRGIHFQTPLAEIIWHLSHHGSHHRGQITLLLRLEGQEPAPQLDAIAYFRAQQP